MDGRHLLIHLQVAGEWLSRQTAEYSQGPIPFPSLPTWFLRLGRVLVYITGLMLADVAAAALVLSLMWQSPC